MEKHIFLAFDLGATSGRSILGTVANGKVEIKELTRFPNAVTELHGKYYWNMKGRYWFIIESCTTNHYFGIGETYFTLLLIVIAPLFHQEYRMLKHIGTHIPKQKDSLFFLLSISLSRQQFKSFFPLF